MAHEEMEDVLGHKDRVGAKYVINTTLTSAKLVQRTLHGSYIRNHRDLRACSTNRDLVLGQLNGVQV